MLKCLENLLSEQKPTVETVLKPALLFEVGSNLPSSIHGNSDGGSFHSDGDEYFGDLTPRRQAFIRPYEPLSPVSQLEKGPRSIHQTQFRFSFDPEKLVSAPPCGELDAKSHQNSASTSQVVTRGKVHTAVEVRKGEDKENAA